MFKKIIFYILLKLLIVEICSISYLMHKENSENNEFNPYIFTLTLDNQLNIYPSYFNMCSFYIRAFEDKNDFPIFSKENIFNISIHNQSFNYINTSTGVYNKTYASVGISKNFTNFKEFSNIEEYNKSYFCFLDMIAKEQENNQDYKGSFISFVQKENDKAVMSFGELDSKFDTGISNQCQIEYGYYFSCQVSSIKIGVNEIYSSSTVRQEIGIFSISDEYIILPNKAGNETTIYYTKKIKELFDVECKDESSEKDEMSNITCDYFNYEDLPDLYFEMKGGMGVMALSIDMFKILSNFKLELKLKYRKKPEDININLYLWILGEPVTKNYNFFVNYTDTEKPYLILVPSSLNGFILIMVATGGGFLFLFVFLIIIICSTRKDKKLKKNIEEKGKYDIFSIDKNSTNKSKEEDGKKININDDYNEDEDNIINDDNKSENDLIDNDNIDNNIQKEENKFFNLHNNDELKNLKMNEIQNDNLNNNNKIITNNINNKNEININTSEKIMKNINNVGGELISNNVEDAFDEKNTFL